MMLLRSWGRIWRQEELCKHSDQQRDSKVKELSLPWFIGALRDESQLELGLRLGQTKIEHIRVLFGLDWQWDLPSMLVNRELQRYQTSTCIGERLPKKQKEKEQCCVLSKPIEKKRGTEQHPEEAEDEQNFRITPIRKRLTIVENCLIFSKCLLRYDFHESKITKSSKTVS